VYNKGATACRLSLSFPFINENCPRQSLDLTSHYTYYTKAMLGIGPANSTPPPAKRQRYSIAEKQEALRQLDELREALW
jgi:hypothetical protein